MDVVLTLEIPTEYGNFVGVAMTADQEVLVHFKANVLLNYAAAVQRAVTAHEKAFRSAELEHMERVLNHLIPENGNEDKYSLEKRNEEQ